MGLSIELVKKLLLIACILGVLQGLLTLIGGITACFDRNKDVIFKSYCSSMTSMSTIGPLAALTVLTGMSSLEVQNSPRSGSRKIQEIARKEIVATARLIRRIEVGLRDSIRIVRLLRIKLIMIALQE